MTISTISMTEEQFDALDAFLDDNDMSQQRSRLIRRALFVYLTENPDEWVGADEAATAFKEL